MSNLLIRLLGLFLLSPFAFAVGITEMPEALAMEMCRALSDESTSCVKGKILQHSQTIKLNGDQLLSYFHMKSDKEHTPLSVPLSLNAQGKWKLGQGFIGQPRRIQADSKGRLWMQASYFFLTNKPLMYMSIHGQSWKEVPLPFDDDAGKSFYQRDIGRWCVAGESLFLELMMSTETHAMSKRFWQANIKRLLEDGGHSSQKWKILQRQSLDDLDCESVKAKKNDWEVQEGEGLLLFLLEKNKLTVKLPKVLVLGDNQAKSVAVEKGRFAIQVAAYRQHSLANGVVELLQKAKFLTFTRTVDRNGQSLKRVYIGPFAHRDEASKTLVAFKKMFSENAPFQSAYVMRLP